MASTFYDISTKSNGTFRVKYNTGQPTNWTRGETASYTFEFPQFNQDLTVSGSYTVSGVESFNSVTVESGATLTIPSGSLLQAGVVTNNGTINNDGTLSVNSRFKDVLGEYMEWAGSYATVELLDNTVKYRPQIPDNIGISSLVWGIQPSQHIRDLGERGVWGLVDSVSNERNQPLSINRFTVDVTVLGEYGDYAGISDVETNLLI